MAWVLLCVTVCLVWTVGTTQYEWCVGVGARYERSGECVVPSVRYEQRVARGVLGMSVAVMPDGVRVSVVGVLVVY
eukprot:COSAG01_NODE_36323_length_519_cov_1.204762_1_plen_76_part_00